MSTTQYRIEGEKYGLPGFDAVITIPTQVDGKGIGEFPRNEMEQGMLDQVLDIFSIKPDFDLNTMKNSQTLDGMFASIITNLTSVYKQFKPDIVLVHGDTSTTFALKYLSAHF